MIFEDFFQDFWDFFQDFFMIFLRFLGFKDYFLDFWDFFEIFEIFLRFKKISLKNVTKIFFELFAPRCKYQITLNDYSAHIRCIWGIWHVLQCHRGKSYSKNIRLNFKLVKILSHPTRQ